MNEFKWTADMGEISGFGRSYEHGCRVMVKAAVLWLRDHPHFRPTYHGFKNVVGLTVAADLSAKALDQAMVDACKEQAGDGPTGAMHEAALSHAFFIHKNGWDAYAKELRDRETRERSAATRGE